MIEVINCSDSWYFEQHYVKICINCQFLKSLYSSGIFLRGWGQFWKLLDMFIQTCPNDPEVGVIDNPERFEDVLEPCYVREVVKIFFTCQISKVQPHKMSKKWPFLPLARVLVRFYAWNQKVHMPSFAGYGLCFFIYAEVSEVMIFEYYRFLKWHYIDNTNRYDKTTAIYCWAGNGNFLLLGTKISENP